MSILVERGLSLETWAISQEVEDVIQAANRVFQRLPLSALPVSISSEKRMSSDYREELLRTHAVFKEFNERGFPLEYLEVTEASAAVGLQTPEGPKIVLSVDYFGPYLSDKSDMSRLSAYAIQMFSAICHTTIRSAAEETLISQDSEDIHPLIWELTGSVKKMSVETQNPNLISYADDLGKRLVNHPNLRIVGKGQRIMLRDDELIYIHEFADMDLIALNIIEQHLRRIFIREMKKTQWFVPPEKWSLKYRDIYKKTFTELSNDIGDVDVFLEDYLKSALAKKGFMLSKEAELELEEEDKQGLVVDTKTAEDSPADTRSAIHLNGSIPEKTNKQKPEGSKGKKKERKKKIYPNQKVKLEIKKARQEQEDKIAQDGLAIIRDLLVGNIPIVDPNLKSFVLQKLNLDNKE